MKIILLKDVPKVGHKFDLKDVADGYALNFLIPRKLAEVATPAVLKRTEVIKTQLFADKKIKEDLLVKSLRSIEGITVSIQGKTNEKGHLFAGIHKENLVPEIAKQTGFELLPEFIDLPKPIKEVGEHTVTVKVGDKSATIKVVVKTDK